MPNNYGRSVESYGAKGHTRDAPESMQVTNSSPADPVRVVFIAGMSRSGSTLLDRLLGQLPGWWTLGEVVHLWTRGVIGNELCGCGRPFLDCSVWNAIGDEAFGGWKNIDAEEVVRLKQAVERDRYTHLLIDPSRSRRFRRRLDSFNELKARLYNAARMVTGASVIVDSSKHMSTALALRQNQAIDLRPVHLVRDSRGVAYSFGRVVPYTARPGEVMMPRKSPLVSSMRYVAYNSLLAVAFRSERHFVRYEDLARDPDDVIARLCRWATRGECQHDAHTERPLMLHANHGLAGNPMRGRSGSIEIRVDEEWKRAMSPVTRRLVTAITAPNLVLADYPLRARRAADAP